MERTHGPVATDSDQLKFCCIDTNYINALRAEEIKRRGFSCVPKFEQNDPDKPRYFCGVALHIHGLDYYVPISSKKQQQADNCLLRLSRYPRTGKEDRPEYSFDYIFERYHNVAGLFRPAEVF